MVTMNQVLKYTGTKQPSSEEMKKGKFPYLPSSELVNAVNLAIFLVKRPLLIKGDPGSGKTRLAEAIAFELGLDIFEWHVKSTSRAKDGLYIYDAIQRLHDVQLASKDAKITSKVENPSNYIKFGPLGKAFLHKNRSVILIDEIDKADIDFPNDLLLELDQQKFYIDETDSWIFANYPPIVIITSNDEKELPDAFLRRCLFHYIEFPSTERLIQILSAHFDNQPKEVVELAVRRFMELRSKMELEKGKTGKKVSTSELIDWFSILSTYQEDEVFKLLEKKLPFPEVLLKSWDDHLHYLSNGPG